MFHRLFTPPRRRSFFLFGPRGTGKTTLLGKAFSPARTLFIDLLDPAEEDLFNRRPSELEQRVHAMPPKIETIVIDEVQKAPKVLDSVHRLIEKERRVFALTGSSPIKLKRGASNLLAGRAFVYPLHPLTHSELGDDFRLGEALHRGTLPGLFQLASSEDKREFLMAYALTYLKEEIAMEQVVRRLNPFRNFLEVAAQCNGTILNFTQVARDVGVDTKTAQSYFTILEDTLIGFFLPAYHVSVRKKQRTAPKFYLFDPGIKKALERTLDQIIHPKTYAFGAAFEHWVILEFHRLSQYRRREFSFSYLRTRDGAEIDLVVDRPGKATALVEIKSTDHVEEKEVGTLAHFQNDMSRTQAFCLSLDPYPKKIGVVRCLPWAEGIQTILDGT